MKKLLFTLLAIGAAAGVNAQTYTDITPIKFDFNTYETGALPDFWNAYAQLGHAPAESLTGENSVYTLAKAANFTDGYAYFYFNQPTDPSAFTEIAEVDGVGKVLKFGDVGMTAGFGGFYLLPTYEQTEGYMRTTIVFRVAPGENTSNTGASVNVGVRNEEGEGINLTAITYTQLETAYQEGKWFKAVAELDPTYNLRFNYAQLIWGDNIEIAQVKFEKMSDVPEGYEPVREIITGTAEELGIVAEDTPEEPGEFTYTDITPSKFDFSAYNPGAIDNFWNSVQQVNHAVAGSATDEKGVITVAQAADFTDGFAYFYFNQPVDPNSFTEIVEVDGVGKVLQFGDAGLSAGFGGCYFVPSCQQTDGYMRTTFVYRKVDGTHDSNTGASMNVGVRDTEAAGPDLTAVSYSALSTATEEGKWYQAIVEYCPTYALRVNYAQLIWGDNIQIAQIKFEAMANVPEDYEPVKSVISGTPEELGIASAPSGINGINADKAAFSINGNIVTFNTYAEVYNINGAKVAQGKSATLLPGLYIANVNGNGVKFIIR